MNQVVVAPAGMRPRRRGGGGGHRGLHRATQQVEVQVRYRSGPQQARLISLPETEADRAADRPSLPPGVCRGVLDYPGPGRGLLRR